MVSALDQRSKFDGIGIEDDLAMIWLAVFFTFAEQRIRRRFVFSSMCGHSRSSVIYFSSKQTCIRPRWSVRAFIADVYKAMRDRLVSYNRFFITSTYHSHNNSDVFIWICWWCNQTTRCSRWSWWQSGSSKRRNYRFRKRFRWARW